MPLYSLETYGDLHPWIAREWLLTNGTGGFASSTVAGCNTRRYHGLLVAATLPPVGRIMALNRIAESLHFEGDRPPAELSVNQFQDEIAPRGDRLLRRFDLGDTARFEYDAGGARAAKEVLLPRRRQVVGVRYEVTPTDGLGCKLQLMPFVSLRDFHALRRSGEADFHVRRFDSRAVVSHRDLSLSMRCDGALYADAPDWWYGHVYPLERERGLDDREDLFTPGHFTLDCPAGVTSTCVLWAGLEPVDDCEWDAQLDRNRATSKVPEMPTPAQRRLVKSADDFVVRRDTEAGGGGTTILAGYPWFADWGRDTMIALPGLLLATGRHHEAGQVLTLFAGYVSGGMIPNRFDDYTNEPTYNTVDASLWFVHAAHEYLRVSRDAETFESLLRPACRQILDGYAAGTRFGIAMDPADGLIRAGDPNTQLTWMDAKTNGVAFTPRHGKAVEINALWYHALTLMADPRADRVRETFAPAFYLGPDRGLADVVTPAGRDESIRPNQIFAAGLPNSPLDDAQQRAVVDVVRRELLTPFGLRTLARSDPRYEPTYAGGPFARDRAYHNGTIWPWPVGYFLDAHLRVHRRSPESVDQARAWLRPLVEALETCCVGSVNEIYEAESPHRPVGAPAQAWSIAEVLRLAVELEM